MDNKKNKEYFDCGLELRDQYKLKHLDKDILQEIADTIFRHIEPQLLELKKIDKLKDLFGDYDPNKETIKEPVKFTILADTNDNKTKINEITLRYPKWIITRSGKEILNRVYTQVFEPKGQVVNYTSLDTAFQKINFIPNDIVDLFHEIRYITCN
ncbi:MAG: hypothetical protein AB4063_18060 [Crocosphaera sp.]